MEGRHKVIFEISTMSIVKVFAVILGLLFLYSVRDVILLFFIVLIITAALNPIVNKWQKEIPRNIAIILLFIIIGLTLAVAALLVLPPLIEQIRNLANNLPEYMDKIKLLKSQNISSESKRTLVAISDQLSNLGRDAFTTIGKNLINTTLGIFGGIVATLTVLASTFYLLTDEENIKKTFKDLSFGKKEEIADIVAKIGDKMGAWLRGQLLLMLIVGAWDLIGLLILGVPYPLTLAVWAGLTEIVPYVGPLLGAIPAVLIGFTISPLVGILVIVLFVVIQQLEAHILVPRIMGKAVGLNPVIIIFAILIGSKLMGLLGVLLAIPAAAAISVFIQEYPSLKKD